MKAPIDIAAIAPGTRQGQAYAPALDPSYFNVDDRTLIDRVAQCARLASVLRYYDLQNKPDGFWDSLLLADVSVLAAAMVAHINPGEVLNRLLDFENGILAATHAPTQKRFAQHYFATGFNAIAQINRWYQLSNQNFADNALTRYLAQLIDEAGSNTLNAFYPYYAGLAGTIAGFKNEAAEVLQTLDPRWRFTPAPVIQTTQTSKKDAHDHIIAVVKDAHQAAIAIFTMLHDIARETVSIFHESLNRQNITPHVGLLLTFFDLLQHQQAALNTITGRHMRFYYRDVLGFEPRPATPDETYIVCRLAPGKTSLTLPAAARLAAGKDENNLDIVFETTRTTELNQGIIAQYLTLNLPRAADGTLIGMSSGTIDGFDTPQTRAWSFFGEGQATSATLGFAFSCRDLLLAQGQRTVSITLSLDATSALSLGKNYKSLGTWFEFQVTTPAGWQAVPGVITTYDLKSCQLAFLLQLPPAFPPVIIYDSGIHGAGLNTPWPACRVVLTDTGRSAYPSLMPLTFTGFSITATVTGLKEFTVRNEAGKLPTTVACIPFNPAVPGASITFGSAELAGKQLNYLRINLFWSTLPPGFKTYYQVYNDYYARHDDKFVFQNQSFEASLFTLQNEKWTSVNSGQRIPLTYRLFTSEGPDDEKELPLVAGGVKSITLPPFTPGGDETCVRMTLTGPAKGFGQADYPAIVTEVALDNSGVIMHNARWYAFHKEKTQPPPALPYVPRVNTFALDYQSSYTWQATSPVQSLQWYHLHPWGIAPAPFTSGAVALLPAYDQTAYAFLGLSGITPGAPLSILLQLAPADPAAPPASGGQRVSYEYLTDTGWTGLPITADGTDQLLGTGILRFALPQDSSCMSPSMPGSLYWLRVACSTALNINCSYLSSQAVPVKRILAAPAQPQPVINHIPPGTITAPLQPLEGLQGLSQPLPSAGGRPAENDLQFYQRASLRLSIKNRVVSAANLEALALQQFPSLYLARALPLGYASKALAGQVRLVAVPYTRLAAADRYRPLAPSALLNQIRQTLQTMSIAGVTVEVVNPVWSVVQIYCKVRFTTSGEEGRLQQQLNEDLCHYLSPWIADNPVQALSTPLSPAALRIFLQSRPYIGAVTDVTLTEEAMPGVDPLRAGEKLSVPALQHHITVLDSISYPAGRIATPNLTPAL